MQNNIQPFTTTKSYLAPSYGNDPCPTLSTKFYNTAPQLYVGFQPTNLSQFTAKEALKYGTLWKVFNDPYENPYGK